MHNVNTDNTHMSIFLRFRKEIFGKRLNLIISFRESIINTTRKLFSNFDSNNQFIDFRQNTDPKIDNRDYNLFCASNTLQLLLQLANFIGIFYEYNIVLEKFYADVSPGNALLNNANQTICYAVIC